MNAIKKKPQREIRNFLTAITAGIALAAAAIGAGAYCFDRCGSYTPANLLLIPEMMGRMVLTDRDPETHVRRDWCFDRVEVETPHEQRYTLPQPFYRELYHLIAKQPSEDAVAELFEGERVYRLFLTLAPTGRYALAYEPHLLQQVEMTCDGAHLRIQLPLGGEERRWAYFDQSRVGERMRDLLLKEANQ